jgi:glutamate dehydrogenase/leucine dehydrogenase
VQQRLGRFMREAWDAVVQTGDEFDCSLRKGANILAVRRVADADHQRGLYA